MTFHISPTFSRQQWRNISEFVAAAWPLFGKASTVAVVESASK